VVSPLLANIALHGLETAVTTACGKTTMLVRYADDFVVLHEDKAVIQQAQAVAEQWLRKMGLELKPSKTRIAHTLYEQEGRIGFDFLGFQVRQFAVGKTHSARNSNGKPLGFKTIITPSKAAIKRHLQTLRTIVQRDKGANQAALITHLNPVIRGWTRYYSTVVVADLFGRLDYLTYQKLRAWAYYQHPHKSRSWIARRYWHPSQGKWTFAVVNGPRLYRHFQTEIRRHVKVAGTRSVFDGDMVYWAMRVQHHPLLSTRRAKLLKRDGGRCGWCGLYFRDGDTLELDHLLPRTLGGSDQMDNLRVLHQHCHDAKSAQDGTHASRGTHDQSQ
jgi:RNA-directed DNA polymerase